MNPVIISHKTNKLAHMFNMSPVYVRSAPPTFSPGHRPDRLDPRYGPRNLFAFSCNPKLLKCSRTVSHNKVSGASVPKEITSSRYTRQLDQRMPDRTRSVRLSKVSGELQSPKGIPQNWKSPSCVTNAAFRLPSGDKATYQYPLAKFIVENHCWRPSSRNESSIRGQGYTSFAVAEFKRR